MRNLLTVEVEEYFHDEGYAEVSDRRGWARRESRVRRQTERLLDLIERRRARATFFVLGWTAERDPALVREIAARGHEVASHGTSHLMVDQQNERGFRRDVRRSKHQLEDVLGGDVVGYRAPGFSINERTPWAHRVLAEEGFAYSSSVCPARLSDGAEAARSAKPWKADCGDGVRLLEFPPLTRRLSGQNVPVAGGSYLRLLPVRVVSNAIAAMNAEDAPAVVSLRPWEIDASQADVPETTLSRWRHWAGVAEFEAKLDELLGLHEFGPVAEFAGLRPQQAAAAKSLVGR